MTRRFARMMLGLAAATALVAPAASADDAKPKTQKLGTGPAYRTVGGLAVMHNGRIKPWDTVAREEVKQIYGRQAIALGKLPDGKPAETWEPTAAMLDWSARPSHWDDQPIILVEFTPLKRKILGESIAGRLASILGGSAPAAAKDAARTLADKGEIGAADLRALAAQPGLAEADKAGLVELADKLSESHKWLSPRELEEARVSVEGKRVPFESWVRDIDARRRAGGMGEAKLPEIEEKAYQVGVRLLHYQAVRDRDYRVVQVMNVLPRPNDAKALAFIADAVKAGRESGFEAMSPLQYDAFAALASYWKGIQGEDRAVPGTDPKFDERFSGWLRDNSVWVPLKVVLDAKPDELEQAGFPRDRVEAFRDAFAALEQAEQSKPGAIDPAAASALIESARALGNGLNAEHYPTAVAMEREIYFNESAPFFKAPMAYGVAMALLLLSLTISAERGTAGGIRKGLYGVGLFALGLGIALEVFGFYLRIRISGWAPVTNMYETVIWVALVTAVLGAILEAIYRKVYAAAAAAGVAFFTTLIAATTPTVLDPDIPQLQPVLRSNYWLVIHVLTIVSSYAAFALAMGLGLIATGYYLTATYRRSPGYAELVAPLGVGLPVLGLGLAGVYAAYGGFGPQYETDGTAFYLAVLVAAIGGLLTGAGIFAPLGEAFNRAFLPLDEGTTPEGGDPATEWAAAERSEAERLGTGGAGAATATAVNPVVAAIRARAEEARPKLDPRGLAMQATAAKIKPLANFIYRAMQVGVLLVAAGTILGGVWADYSWGRFWGWDPKEVWALITLLVYLVPLHGRFAGWTNTFTLVMASVGCFLSVLMAWYGVNFVLGVGLHSYGFSEGGGQGIVISASTAVLSICAGAYWRRMLASRVA